jgi:cold shock CspA family protein
MSVERLTGRVKWFNSKNGYGFISVCDDSDRDIFAHYSCIRGYSSVRDENFVYKFLVQGEYVEFDLVKTEDEKHEYKANDISGIKNGPLMCDTQAENSRVRKNYKK